MELWWWAELLSYPRTMDIEPRIALVGASPGRVQSLLYRRLRVRRPAAQLNQLEPKAGFHTSQPPGGSKVEIGILIATKSSPTLRFDFVSSKWLARSSGVAALSLVSRRIWGWEIGAGIWMLLFTKIYVSKTWHKKRRSLFFYRTGGASPTENFIKTLE